MPKTPTRSPVSSARERVNRHRESLRARGLRPVTRWIPDTRDPKFIERYRAQIAALTAKSEAEGAEFWEWIERVQCTDGWV